MQIDIKMSENERHGETNVVVENSPGPTIRESTMTCGWCKKFNDAVSFCQTPFDIAVILEQVANCSVLLRGQMSMETVARMNQK